MHFFPLTPLTDLLTLPKRKTVLELLQTQLFMTTEPCIGVVPNTEMKLSHICFALQQVNDML